MAENLSRSGVLSVSTDGSTYYAVGEVLTVTPSWEKNKADTTSWDDAGWTREKTITRRLTLSAEMNYDETDVGQAILLAAVTTGTSEIYVRYRPKGSTTGYKEAIFLCEPTGETPADGGDVIKFSVELASNGAVTWQAQS